LLLSAPARPAPPLLGSTTPRLWTPPLRELTPATSVGFHQVEFARDWLGRPADPWQEWLLIHAGELLPDGRPRFRIVIVLVARQNGKTELLVILSAYWQFVQAVPLILGTSTKLDYAKESWTKAVKLIEAAPEPELALLRGAPRRWTRDANGEQESWTTEGSRYKIAASNEEGGRSLTVHRLICDELRQHHNYSAWDAAEPATAAVPDAQIWGLSNAGSDKSVVLNDHRDSALKFIEWVDEVGAEHVGELLAQAPGDYRLGLFEWSAPDGSDPLDPVAQAQANPQYGRRIEPESLMLSAKRAVEKGGDALIGFKTERLCMRVPRVASDPEAIPTERWAQLRDARSLPGEDVVFQVEIDNTPTGRTASITSFSPRPDGRGHIEVVAHRPGTAWLIPALVTLKALHDPVAFGLNASGPAGSLVTGLAAVGIAVPEDPEAPPRGALMVLRSADAAKAWEQFAAAVDVDADAIRHTGQQLPLDTAVSNATVKQRGDLEVLARRTAAAGGIGPFVGAVNARWTYFERIDKIVEPEAEPEAWIL
jgi:hypothetical protein